MRNEQKHTLDDLVEQSISESWMLVDTLDQRFGSLEKACHEIKATASRSAGPNRSDRKRVFERLSRDAKSGESNPSTNPPGTASWKHAGDPENLRAIIADMPGEKLLGRMA